jgi:hypothetical protein
MSGIRAIVLLAAIASAAPAQVPDTRLIDAEPKIHVGPPPVAVPGVRPGLPLPPPPPDDRASEPDRRIDLDLDLKERRESRGGDSSSSAWLAAAVFVAAGVILFLLVTWVFRRGGR